MTPDEAEQRRLDKRWERLQANPRGVGSGALGELLSAFSPAVGHAVDEMRRLENTRVQETNGADPLGVDLEKGVVRIRRASRSGGTASAEA